MCGLLESRRLTRNRFGGILAVNELGFHLDKGEILGLIRPDVAGKTTVFNMISRVTFGPPTEMYFLEDTR